MYGCCQSNPIWLKAPQRLPFETFSSKALQRIFNLFEIFFRIFYIFGKTCTESFQFKIKFRYCHIQISITMIKGMPMCKSVQFTNLSNVASRRRDPVCQCCLLFKFDLSDSCDSILVVATIQRKGSFTQAIVLTRFLIFDRRDRVNCRRLNQIAVTLNQHSCCPKKKWMKLGWFVYIQRTQRKEKTFYFCPKKTSKQSSMSSLLTHCAIPGEDLH